MKLFTTIALALSLTAVVVATNDTAPVNRDGCKSQGSGCFHSRECCNHDCRFFTCWKNTPDPTANFKDDTQTPPSAGLGGGSVVHNKNDL